MTGTKERFWNEFLVPDNHTTAIVSPNALPNPRNIAESTPGPEARKMTFFTVSHFVAPNESDASFKAVGTELKDSIHNEIIIGKTIIDKIKEAVNRLNPELIVYPKNGAIVSRTQRDKHKKSTEPKDNRWYTGEYINKWSDNISKFFWSIFSDINSTE